MSRKRDLKSSSPPPTDKDKATTSSRRSAKSTTPSPAKGKKLDSPPPEGGNPVVATVSKSKGNTPVKRERPKVSSVDSSPPVPKTRTSRTVRSDTQVPPSATPQGKTSPAAPKARVKTKPRPPPRPSRRSQSKLSGDEVTPTKDKPEPSSSSTPEQHNKPVPSTSTPVPPHEERSAPEGTSSPTPRPSDTSERKSSSSRPNSIPSEGYMTATEVQKLLKQQELQFEEKLLRSELVSGEKEKKLRQAMKDEQKEMSTLGESVSELTQSRDALLKLVGQYKGMLASLVSEKEKEKQNQEERIKTLEQERNQALDDLANVEVAFSDVHRKYERTKQVVDTLRRNEETLRGAVTDYENKLQKQEQKFIEFQKHAEEKIQLANEEFEGIRRVNDQEMTKMGALLKKAEMKIMSLTDSNDRKTRENTELTQLCDDLINKVGTSH